MIQNDQQKQDDAECVGHDRQVDVRDHSAKSKKYQIEFETAGNAGRARLAARSVAVFAHGGSG